MIGWEPVDGRVRLQPVHEIRHTPRPVDETDALPRVEARVEVGAGRRRREHGALDNVVLVDDDRRQSHDPDHTVRGPVVGPSAGIVGLARIDRTGR